MVDNLEKEFNIDKKELFGVFLCICNCLVTGCNYTEIIGGLNQEYLKYFAAVGIVSLSKRIGKEILNNEN